jgi:predicted SprT family Zn-dependent metalloprotease
MARLEIYNWERDSFPAEREISIPYPERIFLPRIIAKKFNLPDIGVECDLNNSGGKAYTSTYRLYIRLPKAGHWCCLGTIYHEVAHILNYEKFKGRGHRGTFKKALIKVYCEARQFIDKARAEAQTMVDRMNVEVEKKIESQKKHEDRASKLKAIRQTPAYKIEQLKKKIKKLETKSKRIKTAISKAQRSLAKRMWHQAKKATAPVREEPTLDAPGGFKYPGQLPDSMG